MKALFIGGTGTISSAVARHCVERGMDLWLLVRGTRDRRLPAKARVLRGDVKHDPAYVSALLAPHTWDCVVDWVAFDEDDVSRDVAFFHGKTNKFIFVSSASVYQKPLPSPIVTEATPIGNTYWSYADKKAKCERLLLRHHQAEGFPIVIVRPGHTYAEFALPTGFAGMGFGIVDRILRGRPIVIHGDGTSLWTLTFNEDFARAFVPLMALDSIIGEAFQITSDELLTWRQIYDYISVACGRQAEYVFATSDLIAQFDSDLGATLLGDKTHSHIFSNGKIRKYVPSFSARVPFADGARRCWNWYRDHKDDITMDARKDALMDAIIMYVEGMRRDRGHVPSTGHQ